MRAHLLADEELVFAEASDLDRQQRFGASHLFVTRQRVGVIEAGKLVVEFKLADLKKVEIDKLFGGARLVAVTETGHHALVYYTQAKVPEFANACRVITNLKRGVFIEPELAEPAYCRRCGAPLPERGANCTACVRRWRVVLAEVDSDVSPARHPDRRAAFNAQRIDLRHQDREGVCVGEPAVGAVQPDERGVAGHPVSD